MHSSTVGDEVWQPGRAMRAAIVTAVVLWLALPVRADEVHLASGRVLEGKAEVAGDKVIVAIESGSITLPQSSVARIERTRPPLEQVREREAALARNDVRGLMELADFCRERELRGKERELLQRVVRLEPDHEIARTRLGYERTDKGWALRTERLRREEGERMEQRRAELSLERERAALEKQRTELALSEAKLERARAQLREQRARESDRTGREREQREQPRAEPLYYVAPAYATPLPSMPAPSGQPAFPINGVRSPQEMGAPLPGVRDPRSYFEGAFKR